MSYFYEAGERTAKETLPGIQLRTWWGEKTMLSLVDLAPSTNIPAHSHPAEQIGMLIEGEMTLTVEGESHLCTIGSVWVVPGGLTHSVVTGPEGAKVVEAFAPVREEYKFPD